MKLSHFAQVLTFALFAVTAYLAWQANEEATKANAKVELLTRQQRAVAAQQAEAQSNPLPGPITPLTHPAPASSEPAVAASLPGLPAMPPLPGPLPEPKASKEVAESSASAGKPAGSPAASTAAAPGNMPLLTPLQRRVKDSPALGKVKQVFLDQGFVALDVGGKHGLKKGLKLDLRRDAAIVGRVTVSDVEDSEAVADLDPKSVPQGVTVQAGDELISIVLDR